MWSNTLWEHLGKPNGINFHEYGPSSDSREALIDQNVSVLGKLLTQALGGSDDELPHAVKSELKLYIECIASNYHPVGFHSFAHASHVVLSATKLCSILEVGDPWLRFCISFSALIHDVGHHGIPNATLKAEGDYRSIKYASESNMSSFAELHSIEMALSLLNRPSFISLRSILSENTKICDRINDLVLCTDIASPQRREETMNHWNKVKSQEGERESKITRGYTDQIMQAADVSHTMQDFSTFLKWNFRLYNELSYAYKSERSKVDPKINWYESQIGFYNGYIIPLAERLDKISSSSVNFSFPSFASLAAKNRDRWILEGKTLTVEMVQVSETLPIFPPISSISEPPQSNHIIAIENSLLKKENPHLSSPPTDDEGEEESKDNNNNLESDDDLLSVDSDVAVNDDSLSIEEMDLQNDDISTSDFTIQVNNASKGNALHQGETSQSVRTVDAVVPRILIEQILETLKSNPNHPFEIRDAISQYNKSGSICRYRGALLFVDISGFTKLAQTYPIEDFKTFINNYFTKIISLIEKFKGQVIKFAGDALYAFWGVRCSEKLLFEDDEQKRELKHLQFVTKCTACALAINAECNDYKVAKSYAKSRSMRRRSSISSVDEGSSYMSSRRRSSMGSTASSTEFESCFGTAGSTNINQYEQHESILYVYCGVSEGTMAGVDVVAAKRAEFFLIGQPLSDVAIAEGLADRGELVVSPSVHEKLLTILGENYLDDDNKDIQGIQFESMKNRFQKVIQPNNFSQQNQSSDNNNNLLMEDKVRTAKILVQEMFDKSLLTDESNNTKQQHSIHNNNKKGSTDYNELAPTPKNNNKSSSSFPRLDHDRNKERSILEEDVLNLMNYHCHEATRDDAVSTKFSAELRTVAILFFKIMYEPTLSTDQEEKPPLSNNNNKSERSRMSDQQQIALESSACNDESRSTRSSFSSFGSNASSTGSLTNGLKMGEEEENQQLGGSSEGEGEESDDQILENFQGIYTAIYDSIVKRNGQVRQFISDDKGTVCIASFGLRGGVTLNAAATAVDAAMEAQNSLTRDIGVETTIGVTLGKVFCGETGSPSRYEYSLLGPAVNLSARLMAKGKIGSVNCDCNIQKNDSQHAFTAIGKHQLKGYSDPVTFYSPSSPITTKANPWKTRRRSSKRKFGAPMILDSSKLMVRESEISELVSLISEKKPKSILVMGQSGTGKTEFINGVLSEPQIYTSNIILTGNQCFHDTPFYCFTPIINGIVFQIKDVSIQLRKIKKNKQRSSNSKGLPKTLMRILLGQAKIFEPTSQDQNTGEPEIKFQDLIRPELLPFLGLVNDFLFQGFPVLRIPGSGSIRNSEIKKLKDDQKAEKCIMILGDIITNYINLKTTTKQGKGGDATHNKKKSAIISIDGINCADDYSKRLIQHICKEEKCDNLMFIGSIKDSDQREDYHFSTGSDSNAPMMSGVARHHFHAIFDSDNYDDCKEVKLEYLSSEKVYDLFDWLLKDVWSQEDRLLLRSDAAYVNRVSQMCGGIPRFAVELANAVNIQYKANKAIIQSIEEEEERYDFISSFICEVPTEKIEELICFRFDHLSAEGQLLLKIASVAGFEKYSFSLSLLEFIVLALSQSIASSSNKTKDVVMSSSSSTTPSGSASSSGAAPTTTTSSPAGTDVPQSIGNDEQETLNLMFQDENFEQVVDSLLEQKFFVEQGAETNDMSSMDSAFYRFANQDDCTIINGLMLDDQKRQIHLEVAKFYELSIKSTFESEENEELSANSNDKAGFLPSSGSASGYSLGFSTTDISNLSWQLLHITALHYEMAESQVPAIVYYFDASTELAKLGIRDLAHSALASSYAMLEKLMHQVPNRNVVIEENDNVLEARQRLCESIIKKVSGVTKLPSQIENVTKENIRILMNDDKDVFTVCIRMLTKFGQSVGTIEKEGYKLGADIYVQAIYLVLLVLRDSAFQKMMERISRFLSSEDSSSSSSNNNGVLYQYYVSSSSEDDFGIDDLSITFPAFSGLLTFFRDSPIEVNREQETLLANLFVAVTEESSKGSVHVLRTKCILSHLYLKHGDVIAALKESEEIKKDYDHDMHSLGLMRVYGMDWSLICLGTMTIEYFFRGEFSQGFHHLQFLEEQVEKLDEFASSTKVMMRQILSSIYILLYQFDKAASLADGIAKTTYPYFYKPSGLLQEELAKKLQYLYGSNRRSLNSKTQDLNNDKMFDMNGIEKIDDNENGNGKDEEDIVLKWNNDQYLSILKSGDPHAINHKRGMLYASIEALTNRGIEAIKAELCMSEILKFELEKKKTKKNNEEKLREEEKEEENVDYSYVAIIDRQIEYCESGLLYLEQSIQQKDADSYEKQTNYLSCLCQKAELIWWHERLHKEKKKTRLSVVVVGEGEIVENGSNSSDYPSPISILSLCEELCISHEYHFMLMLVGEKLVKMGLDDERGNEIVRKSLEFIDNRSDEDGGMVREVLGRIQNII